MEKKLTAKDKLILEEIRDNLSESLLLLKTHAQVRGINIPSWSKEIQEILVEIQGLLDGDGREDALDKLELMVVNNRIYLDISETAGFKDEAIGHVTRDKKGEDYDSPTFKCKSDLKKCLDGSKDKLERMLCYALFTRCVAKG